MKKLLSRKIHGFTLIEMMIVVGIIGIIGAVAYPRLEMAKRSHALKSEALAVISQIKYIEQMAVDEGVLYRLYFDESKKQCIVRKDTDTKDLRVHIFDSGINFDPTHSDGLWDAGSEKYLEVMGEKGIVDGTEETVIALKALDGSFIYVRIFQGRKIEITWE